MLAGPQSAALESLRYLSPVQIAQIATEFGTPVYVYSEAILIQQAATALALPVPYGLTVRYAMKANPLAYILQTFSKLGIEIDASSGEEVHRATKAGYKPGSIMLTSQQLPADLTSLVHAGVKFNATSLHQLETYGRAFPGTDISVRINTGYGSGHTRSVSVAGPSSSFGIWHEEVPAVRSLIKKYRLQLATIHSHIGCGTDPKIWIQAARKTLAIVDTFPSVSTLDLGGGFKVARLQTETPTDLQALGASLSVMLTDFYRRTGRRLKVEIEPGTFLVANAGTLLASVEDITTTGARGYTFVKLNIGMDVILRPALHGSQHPIVAQHPHRPLRDYVVVGHNCESTDLLTPSPGNSEIPQPRQLPELKVSDIVALEGAGAYCSAMRIVGYNSFATPNEIMLTAGGRLKLISRSIGVNEFTAGEIYD